MRITEENFVSEMIAGNEKTIAYVIEHYGWIIKSVVTKHLYYLSHYQEDCMNDILLAVWQHIDRFKPDLNSFKNWLAGVSKYTALNYVRKYKRELEQEPLEAADLATGDITYEENVKDEVSIYFKQILEYMKKEDQELFISLYIKEQSVQEISQATGMKKEVIYNRLSRAKSKVKKPFKI